MTETENLENVIVLKPYLNYELICGIIVSLISVAIVTCSTCYCIIVISILNIVSKSGNAYMLIGNETESNIINLDSMKTQLQTFPNLKPISSK